MAVDIMKGVRMPDGTIIELQDWGRGKSNGVATLNENSKLVQDWEGLVFASQISAPLPYTNTYTLTEWLYLFVTGRF